MSAKPLEATDLVVDPTASGSSSDALVCSGAERVELSERFYRGIFVGCLVFIGLASLAALALLPLREPVGVAASPTIALTAALVVATAVGLRRSQALYLLLRREPRWELLLVAVAAALVAYPLRSELWWPSCALLMLVGTLAPLQRTAAYCLAVVLINLAAHAIAGDLDETPAVTITGLWVGFGFWSAAFALSTDRLAGHILRLQHTPAPAQQRDARLRVNATVVSSSPAPSNSEDGSGISAVPDATRLQLNVLTFRQLQVVSLLGDGLRYAEVAASLGISTRQVQRHVTHAIARLGVSNANELVAAARAHGMS